ncbi:MAG: tetratricopeptide repeat protein [Betaproteobacteria bacterium]
MNNRAALDTIVHHYRGGHLQAGDAACRALLQGTPFDAPLMLTLATLAQQSGSSGMAIELLKRVIGAVPDNADAIYQLGVICHLQGRLDEAIARYRRSIALAPDVAAKHANLGVALDAQGRFDEAVQSLRRSLAIESLNAETHYNLGNSLKALGRLNEAIGCYRRAIELRADFVDAFDNLGVALQEQGSLDEAVSCFRHALVLHPDWPPTLANLGAAMRAQGKVDEAIVACLQAVQLGESAETRVAFAQAIRQVAIRHESAGLRELTRRALEEAWIRPAELLLPALSLVRLNPAVRDVFVRATDAGPYRHAPAALFGSAGLSAVANDALLKALLENTQANDAALEKFLTMARAALLSGGGDGELAHLPFWCALARQCFINGYVFAVDDAEAVQAAAMRDGLAAAIAAKMPVPPGMLATVGAYFPLGGVAGIETLLTRPWPGAVDALLTQQAREPARERAIAAGMARATVIADAVSQRVRQQYEENPYPRWVRLPAAVKPVLLAAHLNGEFPHAAIAMPSPGERLEILVAGCGTGQHSIETAREYRHAHVLAVDLSLASLGYAQRKSEELGVNNIGYAQADIMELDAAWSASGPRFDVIESVGVLHHLADPVAGWRVLRSLLRPRGLMRLGFYSERARQAVVAAREFIAGRRYGSSAEDIRRCRQDILAELGKSGASSPFARLPQFSDFYGTSECRDLLFHVQEHRYELPQLKRMLDELDLEFIGFTLEAGVRRQYGALYPGDPARTDLDNWHAFEMAFPDTFAGMYQFWVRKRE